MLVISLGRDSAKAAFGVDECGRATVGAHREVEGVDAWLGPARRPASGYAWGELRGAASGPGALNGAG